MDLKQNEQTTTNNVEIKSKENNKTKTKSKNKVKISKKTRRIMAITVIILILLLVSILVYKYFFKDRLSYYENKMIEYGLADKYNNGTPNDEENVTKSEAVKMIIEAMLNDKNISNYTKVYEDEFYSNFTWVLYATKINIIDYDYITDKNETENILCVDAIKILYKLIDKIDIEDKLLLKDLQDKDVKVKNKNEYSQEEINAITKLISYGIIDNNYSYKKDELLTKELFNKMLVNFFEKYEAINE